MKFKKSKYYIKDFLGENLYNKICLNDNIETVQEFFNMNNKDKTYSREMSRSWGINNKYFKLKIYKNYYQLNCETDYYSCFIVFDKPVHITGTYCIGVIAPEIYIKGKKIEAIEECVSKSLIVNNNYKYDFILKDSKIKNIYFYNDNVYFENSEIDNFYIKNESVQFSEYSSFLNYFKIRIFGKSKNLQNLKSENESFRKRIIHIE